jgi:hypothetical protein
MRAVNLLVQKSAICFVTVCRAFCAARYSSAIEFWRKKQDKLYLRLEAENLEYDLEIVIKWTPKRIKEDMRRDG